MGEEKEREKKQNWATTSKAKKSKTKVLIGGEKRGIQKRNKKEDRTKTKKKTKRKGRDSERELVSERCYSSSSPARLPRLPLFQPARDSPSALISAGRRYRFWPSSCSAT